MIRELLEEGLRSGAVGNLESIIETIESMVSLRGGVENFKRSVRNFTHFSTTLAKQLRRRGNRSDADNISLSERVYKKFMECDQDNSGGISLEEFVCFCGREDVPREMAESMFKQADIDDNGAYSSSCGVTV